MSSITTGFTRGFAISLDYTIRKARLDEREQIQKLIAASARGLSKADYSDEQIEVAIATIFGVDSALIEDGTYFVVERAGELIGCGGWSKRKTLFGGDQFAARDASALDPEIEPAKISSFFHSSGMVAKRSCARDPVALRRRSAACGVSGSRVDGNVAGC